MEKIDGKFHFFLGCVCCRMLNIIKMNTNIATRWVNLLIPDALFFYRKHFFFLLKTSENRKVFGDRERVHWEELG